MIPKRESALWLSTVLPLPSVYWPTAAGSGVVNQCGVSQTQDPAVYSMQDRNVWREVIGVALTTAIDPERPHRLTESGQPDIG